MSEGNKEELQENNRQQTLKKWAPISQLDLLNRKLHYSYSDSEINFSKCLGPFTYWFNVDSLYYTNNVDYQIGKINNFRKNLGKQSIQDDDDDFFQLKVRQLVSQQKGTVNLQQIGQTSINQVIDILQKYLQKNTQQFEVQLSKIKKQRNQETLSKKQTFNELGIELIDSGNNVFQYSKLQDKLIIQWKKKDTENMKKAKCMICKEPGILISCMLCQLKVHFYCYPITSEQQNYEQGMNLTFTCEGCKQGLQKNIIECVLCPCTNGHFLKTQPIHQDFYQFIPSNSETLLKIQKLSQKPKTQLESHIHLSCLIWNNECVYNPVTRKVQNLDKIVNKKMKSLCDICGIAYGYTICCLIQNCRKSYHAQCAHRKNIEMKYIKTTKKYIEIYCPRHQRQKNYEILERSHFNNLKDMKKYFQGIDREIKRIENLNSYTEKKIMLQYQTCTMCNRPENGIKINVCKSCRKWFHVQCATHCHNCF